MNNPDVVSVLSESEIQMFKEFDAIYGKCKNPQLGTEPSIAAIEEAARKFGEAANALTKALIVVTPEILHYMREMGLNTDGVLIASRFSDKSELKLLTQELSSLQPKDMDYDNGRRKGKGERKLASQQQRKQWRR